MQFELNGMALVTQWFQPTRRGVWALLVGSIGSAITFARKMIQLRCDGVIEL